MPDIRQSLKARREIRFLGAEKQKTGKLSLSYLVRRILDFAHFKLRNRPRQQGEPDLSVEVK